MGATETLKRIDAIRDLTPLREFNAEDEADQLHHINEKWLYVGKEPGKGKRYICSILGTLHQELRSRPDLQRLVLEAVWIARRMNDRGLNQEDMWKDRK